jgi:hypothetical protein
MAPKVNQTGHLDDGHGGCPTKKPYQEKDKDGQDKPQWWSMNPQMVAEWSLPQGKKFGDFFNLKNPDTKENLKGWPKFKHHCLDTQQPMCLKYQATGR